MPKLSLIKKIQAVDLFNVLINDETLLLLELVTRLTDFRSAEQYFTCLYIYFFFFALIYKCIHKTDKQIEDINHTAYGICFSSKQTEIFQVF